MRNRQSLFFSSFSSFFFFCFFYVLRAAPKGCVSLSLSLAPSVSWSLSRTKLRLWPRARAEFAEEVKAHASSINYVLQTRPLSYCWIICLRKPYTLLYMHVTATQLTFRTSKPSIHIIQTTAPRSPARPIPNPQLPAAPAPTNGQMAMSRRGRHG